jgi:hypothetical protein
VMQYEAVANICEDCSKSHDRGGPHTVTGTV